MLMMTKLAGFLVAFFNVFVEAHADADTDADTITSSISLPTMLHIVTLMMILMVIFAVVSGRSGNNSEDQGSDLDEEIGGGDNNVPNRHPPILNDALNALSSNEITNLPDYSLSFGEFSEDDLVQRALDNGFNTGEIIEQAALQHTSAAQGNHTANRGVNAYCQELFHHAMSFTERIRQGDVYMVVSPLDDPENVLEEFQVTDDMVVQNVLPSVNTDGTIDQGRHKSSFLPYMISHLISNASGSLAEPCIMMGGDVYHMHPAPYEVRRDAGGAFHATTRATALRAITAAFEPSKSSWWGNFTLWYSNRWLRALRWVCGLRDMWGGNPLLPQNFMWIPLRRLRRSKSYISGHFKMERLSSIMTYVLRLGIFRWINRYHNEYLYAFAGFGGHYQAYFTSLYLAYTIMPGNFLHPVYALLNPHFYDKTLAYPSVGIAPNISYIWLQHYIVNVANVGPRLATLLAQIIRDRLRWRGGFPPSQPLGTTEEGEIVFCCLILIYNLYCVLISNYIFAQVNMPTSSLIYSKHSTATYQKLTGTCIITMLDVQSGGWMLHYRLF